MKKYFKYKTNICELYIGEENNKITNISFTKDFIGEIEETELIKKAYKQIEEYLKGERIKFDLPIYLDGTEFQKKVWNALIDIPYGKVATYKDIAKKIGNEKAFRAVGNANNKNPIAIVVPCHRVIGANGKLVGYAGGLTVKKNLLEIEKGKF